MENFIFCFTFNLCSFAAFSRSKQVKKESHSLLFYSLMFISERGFHPLKSSVYLLIGQFHHKDHKSMLLYTSQGECELVSSLEFIFFPLIETCPLLLITQKGQYPLHRGTHLCFLQGLFFNNDAIDIALHNSLLWGLPCALQGVE